MSRFTSPLGLTLLLDAQNRVSRTADGRAQWVFLAPPLVYAVGDELSTETITIPPGAVTDLGSTPRFAWSLGFSPDSDDPRAFGLHDFLYRTRGACMFGGRTWRTRTKPYSRAEADAILREALAACGVGQVRRNIIYAAVRVGGASGWGRQAPGQPPAMPVS